MGMTQNCIWGWGSNSGDLGWVHLNYYYSWSTPTQSGRNCFYWSNKSVEKLFVLDRNTWYHIIVCKFFIWRIIHCNILWVNIKTKNLLFDSLLYWDWYYTRVCRLSDIWENGGVDNYFCFWMSHYWRFLDQGR